MLQSTQPGSQCICEGEIISNLEIDFDPIRNSLSGRLPPLLSACVAYEAVDYKQQREKIHQAERRLGYAEVAEIDVAEKADANDDGTNPQGKDRSALLHEG